jgi:hypothetical protein
MGKKSKEHNKKIKNRNERLKADKARQTRLQEQLYQQFMHHIQNEKEAKAREAETKENIIDVPVEMNFSSVIPENVIQQITDKGQE